MNIPAGFVLISITDLQALLGARATTPRAPQPEPASMTAGSAAWESLAATVALVSAHLWQADVDQADIVGELRSGDVVHALTILAAALLAGAFADRGAQLLRHLGELAGTQGNPPQEG